MKPGDKFQLNDGPIMTVTSIDRGTVYCTYVPPNQGSLMRGYVAQHAFTLQELELYKGHLEILAPPSY